ncbi:STAS/SEC14 domain-containing protein [Cereibacter changlensis]|uniref:STAS/SEC14 domain-containing protein n=1 Tax=Cereibacter changlensis TaxID=402884 RepID=UPI0040340A00
MRDGALLKLAGAAAGAAFLVWLARSRHPDGWLDRLDTGDSSVLAFELGGHVGQREIRAMAETVLQAFRRHDSIDMLILLPRFTGLTPAAALDMRGLQASLLSLGKVRRYAVIQPPAWAGAMITLGDWLIPVEARTFRLRQLPEAHRWVSAGG